MIFLAAWRRYKITELCFKGINRLKNYNPEKFKIDALCVGSEKKIEKLCKKHGIKYVDHPNDPVGAKKNHGIREALKYEWDYILELGSDDLLRVDSLDYYATQFEKDEPYFGFNNVSYVNSKTLECRGYISKTVFGAGRAIRRDLIERCLVQNVRANDTFVGDGRSSMYKGEVREVEFYKIKELGKLVTPIEDGYVALWPSHINRALDGQSDVRLAQFGWQHKMLSIDVPIVCDIKSEVNIGQWHPNIGNVELKFKDVVKDFPECGELAS